MCGFTGFYTLKAKRPRSELQSIAQGMSDAIAHRGPDHGDIWQDPDLPLVLAHRRLSIIDLSDDGAQPMASASDRFIIIYNGEIYNYLELQKDLETKGYRFKGHSDTEVILAGFETWGFEKTLQKLNGMFALAVWDRKSKILHFARDRMGKKPLYLGWAGDTLVFASELKALRQHPDFDAALNQAVLADFLSVGYVHAPHCIYDSCWQLPPGHMLSFKTSTFKRGDNLAAAMKSYWSAADALCNSKSKSLDASESEIIDEFESLLSECVSKRLVSDVPLGAFLSGGIDSSSVVALMQSISSSPIKTFSIGFEQAGFNEAPWAAKIAKHLGTDHHEHICTADDALNIIPMLPDMYDEPFADISAIPTYLVSQFARKHVTVALSGDGGDEMLGGYSRHVQGPAIWRKSRMMPRIVREGLSNIIQRVPVNTLDSLKRNHPQIGTKLHKAAAILSLDTQEEIYARLIQKFEAPPVLASYSPLKSFNAPHADLTFAEKMMFWDAVGYLPNDILTKVDRASMAVSLEARAPLLDYRIFEYVWRLPESVKIKNGDGKWLLRQVLKRHVPDALFERPKQGFNMPIGDWLRGPLREWAENLLDENAMRQQGLLDARRIRSLWARHLDGQGNHADALWVVLMFQAWHKRWM